jgi:hypothetical protein
MSDMDDPGVGVTLREVTDWAALDFVLNTPENGNEDVDETFRPTRPVLAPTVQIPAGGAVHIPFADRARRVVIQNNTGATINRQYGGTAGPGSFKIAAGATQIDDYLANDISIYSPNAATVNDAATGDIVIEVGL